MLFLSAHRPCLSQPQLTRKAPKLPGLFPILNRQQYVVRDTVVEGLIRKAQGDCETCRVEAAKQLALCCRAAFGRSDRPFHTYDQWLAASGKAHVDDLCREVDFWEDRYSPGVDEFQRALRASSSLYILGLEQNEFYLKTLPTTISRYKEEIEGKVRAGVCISSAAVLQTALGKLCFRYYMYKDAEDAFRGGAEKKDKLRSLPRWKRGFYPLSETHYDDRDMLAHALKCQGKSDEAVEVLKAIPGVVGDREWKRKFWRKRTRNGWLARLKRRTLVLQWLIAEGRVDEGWESRVIEALRDARDDWWQGGHECPARVGKALSALDNLADALSAENRVQEAVEISRQSRSLHEKYFAETRAKKSDRRRGSRDDDDDDGDYDSEGDNGNHEVDDEGPVLARSRRAQQGGGENSRAEGVVRADEQKSRDPRVWTATRKHAGMLTLGTVPQVEEALATQSDLLLDGTFAETDEETLALLMDRTVGLSRIGRYEEALELAAHVLAIKGAAFGDVHLVSLGFAADLAGSLCLHDRRALETPALMQREVLDIARAFSNTPNIQQQAISLLWSLSRPGSLDESIRKLRALSESCETQYPNQREVNFKLKYWLAFILLYLGATFEDPGYLEESRQLTDELSARARESSGDRPAELVDAARLSAAVQSKVTKLLCDWHGFGVEDFHRFDQAIEAHRSVLQVATEILGSEHPLAEDSRMRLAIVLSDVGVALRREEAIVEARLLFQRMESSPQADYWRYALALANDEEVSDDEMHSAFEKLRVWLVGDTMAVHPGDLALRWHLAEVLLHCDGHHNRARTALSETKKKFHSLRKGWALSPDHHPDMLRATNTYATLQYTRDMPHVGVARTRELNWWAALTHRKESQASTLARYKMSLAVALSSYEEHRAESVAIAEDAARATMRRHGRLHRATALYVGSFGFLNGDRDAATDQCSEALEIFQTMFGPQHPGTRWAGDGLLRVLKHGTDEDEVEEEVRQILEDIESRGVIETSWSKTKLKNACILFCSSVQYLGPTHFLTTSYRSDIELMFEAGGVGAARIESLLGRLASIQFTETDSVA